MFRGGCLLLSIAGCSAPTRDPPPAVAEAAPNRPGRAANEPLTPVQAERSGLTIPLPADSKVHRVGEEVRVTVGAELRHPLQMGIRPLSTQEAGPGPTRPRERKLPNGAMARFEIFTRAAGSGGEEAELRGTITIGGVPLGLWCQHQAETPAQPAPERCLDYLGQSTYEAPTCDIELGETVVPGSFDVGARSADLLFLASEATLRTFELNSEGAGPERSSKTLRTDPHGPVSATIDDIVVNGGTVVLKQDSFMRLFKFDLDGSLVEHQLGDNNVFAVGSNGGELVFAGPRGLGIRRCSTGDDCEETRTAGVESPYDLAISGDKAFVVEGGRELVAFELGTTPKRLSSLPLPQARHVAVAGARVLVSSDSGTLYIIDPEGPNGLVLAQRLRLFRPHRLRAKGNRVWVVGASEEEGARRRIATVEVDRFGVARIVLDTSTAGPAISDISDISDDGTEVLAIGGLGVKRVRFAQGNPFCRAPGSGRSEPIAPVDALPVEGRVRAP